MSRPSVPECNELALISKEELAGLCNTDKPQQGIKYDKIHGGNIFGNCESKEVETRENGVIKKIKAEIIYWGYTQWVNMTPVQGQLMITLPMVTLKGLSWKESTYIKSGQTIKFDAWEAMIPLDPTDPDHAKCRDILCNQVERGMANTFAKYAKRFNSGITYDPTNHTNGLKSITFTYGKDEDPAAKDSKISYIRVKLDNRSDSKTVFIANPKLAEYCPDKNPILDWKRIKDMTIKCFPTIRIVSLSSQGKNGSYSCSLVRAVVMGLEPNMTIAVAKKEAEALGIEYPEYLEKMKEQLISMKEIFEAYDSSKPIVPDNASEMGDPATGSQTNIVSDPSKLGGVVAGIMGISGGPQTGNVSPPQGGLPPPQSFAMNSPQQQQFNMPPQQQQNNFIPNPQVSQAPPQGGFNGFNVPQNGFSLPPQQNNFAAPPQGPSMGAFGGNNGFSYSNGQPTQFAQTYAPN